MMIALVLVGVATLEVVAYHRSHGRRGEDNLELHAALVRAHFWLF